MSKFRLTFEPSSLYQLSEVRICQTLWIRSSRTTLKSKLQELPAIDKSIEYQVIDHILEFPNKDNKYFSQVNNHIDKLNLPKDVKSKLKPLAESMGIIIWEWLEEKLQSMPMKLFGRLLDYVDHIKWTSEGDIDSVETLRSMYYSKVLPDSIDTWNQLSKFCIKDCLVDFYGRVKSLDYNVFQEKMKNDNGYIFSYYWCKFMQNQLDDVIESLESSMRQLRFDIRSEDLNVTMFWVAVMSPSSPAIKYFWETLTKEQRIRTMNSGFRLEYCDEIEESARYERDVEFIIYLWKQFSAYDDKFFIEMLGWHNLMRRVVSWPYDQLFMTTLDKSWNHLDSEDLMVMLRNMFKTISYCNQRDVNLIKYYRIFEEIWGRLDNDYKRSMDFRFCLNYNIGVKFLNKIINDPALVDKRMEYISHMTVIYRLISTNVDDFCTEVLRNDQERERFRSQFTFNVQPIERLEKTEETCWLQ